MCVFMGVCIGVYIHGYVYTCVCVRDPRRVYRCVCLCVCVKMGVCVCVCSTECVSVCMLCVYVWFLLLFFTFLC